MLWHRFNIETGEKVSFEVAVREDNSDFQDILNKYYKELVEVINPLNEEDINLKNFIEHI